MLGTWRPRRRSSTPARARRVVARTAAAGMVIAAIAAMTTPATAKTNADALVPTVARHYCGNNVYALQTIPHTGFNPLTATDAQLAANELPPRPTSPGDLATWKRFVTAGRGMSTCPVATTNRTHVLHDSAPAVTPNALPAQYAEHSPNWAGNIDDDHYYTNAYTTFHVPAADGTSGAYYYKSVWDGIGQGDSYAYPLAQGGVDADWLSNHLSYCLWWELYPWNDSQDVDCTNVHYGDLIYVHSHLSHNDAWVYISNETTGKTYGYSYTASQDIWPDNTAEWIVERPDISGYYPKTSKGTVTFTSAHASGSVSYTDAGDLPHYYTTMWNCTNGPDEQLAYPGGIDSSGGYSVYIQNYGTETKADACSTW